MLAGDLRSHDVRADMIKNQNMQAASPWLMCEILMLINERLFDVTDTQWHFAWNVIHINNKIYCMFVWKFIYIYFVYIGLSKINNQKQNKTIVLLVNHIMNVTKSLSVSMSVWRACDNRKPWRI